MFNSSIFKILKPANKITKVYLAICVHRDIRVQILNLTRQLEKNKDYNIEFKFIPLYGDALISRSRSRVATHFLDTDYDILLFLDDDILYDPKDIVKMIRTQIANDLDIIGSAYVTKEENKPSFTFRGLKGEDKFIFGKDGMVREVAFLATGCMAIKRRVFQGIIEKEIVHLCNPDTVKFYPFFSDFEAKLDNSEKWTHLSEDWAFNYRSRQAGYKVWLDTTIKLQHIGDYRYDWNDLIKAEKPNVNHIDFEVKVDRV